MSHVGSQTLFWLSAACAVVASLAVIWLSRPNRDGESHGGPSHGGPSHSVSDMVWAIMPAVALFAILVLTWRSVQL